MVYRCSICNTVYPSDTYAYRCECGGLFDVEYEHSTDLSVSESWSLWRYRSVLPPFPDELVDAISMGEGATPLMALGATVKGKGEYYMPTLSFKDRGAVMLALHMASIGVKRCAIDSSGNGATAVAAYSARAGIACDVFVPAHTSEKKVAQIEAYGAKVHLIEGPREASGAAVKAFVEEHGVYYASHIYNPLFFEGTKTYLFEIREQMGGNLPDILLIPVGNGTLLTGVALALGEMAISSPPLLVAVQASACAPLAAAFNERGASHWTTTLAEGIAIAEPARMHLLLSLMREFNGIFVEVNESEIRQAHEELAHRGVFIELTSAANWAGYVKLIRENPQLKEKTAVLPLCGAGLKSLGSFS
ncbi:MAG: pyridoxal-phosphate dependent enzyme [Sphaerochaetaceae bacterium]|nr:pyridoxal-phosphate dependent enzyme [Sphaerochaetaceae bacterium]